jgi:hypothetical protein
VSVDQASGAISIRNPNGNSMEPPKIYTFDHVFGDDANQLNIYNLIARPIVDAAIEGFNGIHFYLIIHNF